MKITQSQTRLDKLRSSSRRVKVLSTLYLTFAYLVYAIVVLLVVGHRNMGPYEWTGLAGAPVVIYTTRTLVTSYYNFRIDSQTSRLKDQQEERSKTIQKLKDATKYDSTLELIEKYGGGEGKLAKNQDTSGGKVDRHGKVDESATKPRQGQPQPGRTTMPPPPTANIPRGPEPPQRRDAMEPTAEFAPNAEHSYAPGSTPLNLHSRPSHPLPSQHESRWYDRLFDVILGEDETAPQNRIVLLCSSCRLVNGQAAPGVKSLSDIGRWRCMSCGAHNGVEEDEGKRIVREVLADHSSSIDTAQAKTEVESTSTESSKTDEIVEG